MTRRGDALREHILLTAKDVFLELGFERTSMDVVATRANTSKRSLYAHFENKERLFLAVIDLVRGLFLTYLGMPGDHAEEPAEAVAQFCGRYLRTLLYEPNIQLCRVGMAEAARFPQGAAQHYDVMFAEVHRRLSAYLQTMCGLSAPASAAAARKLLGELLYPRFLRALFGMEELAKSLDGEAGAPDVDLEPIRAAVAEVIASSPTR
jgi:AcrR family transcriptional regulator